MRNLEYSEILTAISEVRLLGYTIIKSVLEQEIIDELLDIILNYQTTGAGKGVSKNQATDKYVYHLQYKSKKFLDIITEWHGGLDIIKPFLQDPYYLQLPKDAYNFLLAYYNARSSNEILPLHIDNYVPSTGSYPNSMQIVYSLNGQREENGATIIVPGSHMSGKWPDRTLNNIAQTIVCDPGDVIIWDSRVWHGALKNKIGADRWSLVATFRPWFMKQNYDPVRGMSEEIYQILTNKQKALCGFLSLPPKDEAEKVSLKEGYYDLKGSLADYRKRLND